MTGSSVTAIFPISGRSAPAHHRRAQGMVRGIKAARHWALSIREACPIIKIDTPPHLVLGQRAARNSVSSCSSRGNAPTYLSHVPKRSIAIANGLRASERSSPIGVPVVPHEGQHRTSRRPGSSGFNQRCTFPASRIVHQLDKSGRDTSLSLRILRGTEHWNVGYLRTAATPSCRLNASSDVGVCSSIHFLTHQSHR